MKTNTNRIKTQKYNQLDVCNAAVGISMIWLIFLND